jgi:hypothetical protein
MTHLTPLLAVKQRKAVSASIGPWEQSGANILDRSVQEVSISLGKWT